MFSDAKLWLIGNEPVISAIVGLVTLSAAVWGLMRLRYLESEGVAAKAAGVSPLPHSEERIDTELPRARLRSTPRKLFNLGITGKSQIEEIVASHAINVTTIALLAINVVWIIGGLLINGFVYFTILNCAVFLIGLLILVLQAGGRSDMARWILLVVPYGYWSITQLSVGKLWGVEYFVVILCLLPILLFKRYEYWQKMVSISLLIGFLAMQLLLARVYDTGLLGLSETALKLGYIVNVPVLCLMIFGIVIYYADFSIKSFHAIEQQKSKADKLVKSVFPADVIKQIRENAKTVASYRDEAAVIFITLSGFEDLYRRVTARQLVEMMSTIFLRFDHLLEKHQIEKINMLSTHYVAASGVFEDGKANHAAVARFALDVTAEVNRFCTEVNHNFSVRAGISVGQVVSGVIGEARPCFDIWGETVELAVSLQDAAVDNTVVVGEHAYWRLKDKFEFAELTSSDGGYILIRELKRPDPGSETSP